MPIHLHLLMHSLMRIRSRFEMHSLMPIHLHLLMH